MLGRLAALLERLGGGFIGCRCWAALSCCDFLRAPSLLPSLPLQIVGFLGVGGGAGSGAVLGAGSAWVQAFPLPWAGGMLALPCWPCVLSASAGCWLSLGFCWPLLGVDCLGAAGCWLWLRLGFSGSRFSAWVQGWQGVQAVPVVVAGLGDRLAVMVAQAHPVRHIAQINPCRFGYYSREKR